MLGNIDYVIKRAKKMCNVIFGSKFDATVQLGTSPPSPSPITAPFYPTTKYLI